MPRRQNSYRDGDRSESYARIVLSALGLAVPVPREEDVGIDFYCTLGQEDGKFTRFFEPYNVQVKSASQKTLQFGGADKKTSAWKVHEIAWILTQYTPFFLALVNKRAARVDLFCTTTRWFPYHAPQVPYELLFRAYTPDSNTDLHRGDDARTALSVAVPPGVEAVRWELPLGQPILSLTTSDVEQKSIVASAREILRQYIAIEVQNYVAAANRVSYFHWPLRITPNTQLKVRGEFLQWYSQPTIFTQLQLRNIAPLVATLLRTYESVNDNDKVTRLGGLLDMLPQDPDLKLVREKIEEGIKMQAGKNGGSKQEG